MERELTLEAHGKINLGLDVIRRLENGYHEVRMIMQEVALADIVTLCRLPEDRIVVKTDSGQIPCDEKNLAYKAAGLMKDRFSLKEGVEIRLEKHIPVAAGMAGGSADCAAVLKGMNELFGLGLTGEELRKEGVKLGADVPYCIMGGTALSEGIGDVLTKLKTPPKCVLLLAKPGISVSTKYVYENLILKDVKKRPDINGMIADVEAGRLKALCEKMGNVLESVTGKRYPVIGEIEAAMKEKNALQAMMSGSGPTVFGVFEKEEDAMAASDVIRGRELAQEVFISSWGVD